LQLADDGYSRRGNVGGSLFHSTVLIYSPDGTNVYDSIGVEVEGIRLKVQSCTVVFLAGHFLFTVHSVTDKSIMMTKAEYDRLKLNSIGMPIKQNNQPRV